MTVSNGLLDVLEGLDLTFGLIIQCCICNIVNFSYAGLTLEKKSFLSPFIQTRSARSW